MRRFYALILIVITGLAIYGAARFTPSAAPDHIVESQALMKDGALLECDVPHAFRMSAQRLRHTAWCTFGPDNGHDAEPPRIAMTEDLYIKAMSYAYLNKTFFLLSVVFAIIVLIWPSFVAFWKNDETEAVVLQTLKTMQKQGQEKGDQNATLSMQEEAAEKITVIKERGTIGKLLSRLVGVAGMQTTVTALAALSFAFYAHYKDNQTTSEGLMRTVIFADDLNKELLDEIIAQMLEMDRGFGFAEALPSIAE